MIPAVIVGYPANQFQAVTKTKHSVQIMSADLFAEFGEPKNSMRGSSPSIINSSSSTISPQSGRSTANANGNPVLIDFFAEEPHWQPSSSPQVIQRSQTQAPESNEVLFDASTDYATVEDSEDEWGEFESAKPDLVADEAEEAPQHSTQLNQGTKSVRELGVKTGINDVSPLLDLLSIDDTNPPSKPIRGPLTLKTKISARTPQQDPDPVTAWPEFEEDNEWGDFSDSIFVEAEKSKITSRIQTVTATTAPTSQTSSVSRTPVPKSPAKDPSFTNHFSRKAVRPTNIPPPSILLRLFPSLLENLCGEALRHSTRSKSKAESLPDPDLAGNIICSLKVMVHILAGRSLRWKRDTILCQSTKIGPAGRSGGLKLSSVNKNEIVKEEKEAVEVLELWSKWNGILNSAVTAAGMQPVQFIPGIMRVIVTTAQDGAIKATHACALCGLRRDERVSKVDEDVDDMFEEWWTEHWGHSHCKRFWEVHSVNLDQR